MYRRYKSIFGLRLGNRQPGSEVDYISLYGADGSVQERVFLGILKLNSGEAFKVQIIYKTQEREQISEHDSQEEAVKTAMFLARHLQVGVYDGNRGAQKWLEVE